MYGVTAPALPAEARTTQSNAPLVAVDVHAAEVNSVPTAAVAATDVHATDASVADVLPLNVIVVLQPESAVETINPISVIYISVGAINLTTVPELVTVTDANVMILVTPNFESSYRLDILLPPMCGRWRFTPPPYFN